MNCDKEYEYQVIGYLLAKVDQETGEEVLKVTKPHRGKGIGFALLKKFISFAHNTGVRRIQWVVLDWNTPAINFYEKQGASTLSDWNITQMTEGAMQKFIAEQDAGI